MKHLLSCKNLSLDWIKELFQRAEYLQKSSDIPQYKHRLALLFYENSTRTRNSFALAGQALGMDLIDFHVESSSDSKGETVSDTLQTLLNLNVKLFVLRHSQSGILEILTRKLAAKNIHLINSGDGMREHPSQALLDLFTMQQQEAGGLENLSGKSLLIIGDCLRSRVAKSNIYLAHKCNMKVRLLGPPSLVPESFREMGVEVSHDPRQALSQKYDFLMALRMQRERSMKLTVDSLAGYQRYYGLNHQLLQQTALEKAKILHPGPVNRGFEMSEDLVDDTQISLIGQQVRNSLYIRMAIFEMLLLDK